MKFGVSHHDKIFAVCIAKLVGYLGVFRNSLAGSFQLVALNGLRSAGKHPGANPAELQKYSQWGELKYIDYWKAGALRFVKEFPGGIPRADASEIIYFA